MTYPTLLFVLASCTGVLPTEPSGETSDTDTGSVPYTPPVASTPGISEPQPGWQRAADVAVVWRGRIHTQTGYDAVVLDLGTEPGLVVAAPRFTDLGGPFPVPTHDPGPRLLTSPFVGGILHDEATAAWVLPDDTHEQWTGHLGRWLTDMHDVLDDGTPQIKIDNGLYSGPFIGDMLWTKGGGIDGTSVTTCDVRGIGLTDVAAHGGLALAPIPRPLQFDDWTIPWSSGEISSAHWGTQCADLDGDGDDEIVLGMHDTRLGAVGVPALYILLDAPAVPADWVIFEDVAHATWTGPANLLVPELDRSFVAGGDLDLDGHPDVFIGGPHAALGALDGTPNTGGRAWLVTNALDGGDLDADAHVVFEPTFNGDEVGAHATFGDFDGDGADDIAIAYGTSRVAVFLGPLDPGTLTDADADAVWYGSERLDDGFGLGLTAGDLDGDGRDELVVGAPYDNTAGRNAGAVYVLWGGGL